MPHRLHPPDSRLLACASLMVVTLAVVMRAQSPKLPEAYTVAEAPSAISPSSQTIYRNGSKAVIDRDSAASGGATKPSRVRTLYDLSAHKQFTWDANDPAPMCGAGTFSGDWGDPFAMSTQASSDLAAQHAKQTGTEVVGGVSTNKLEAPLPGNAGTAAVWLDPNTGLVMKLEVTPPSGPKQTMLEITKVTLGPPQPSIFTLPPSCAAAAAAPTEADRIAAETGGSATDFANAGMPPASSGSCAVSFRVVRAGSMVTVTSGVQVAIDLAVDVNHPAQYVMGQGPNGHETFSGGGLHEVTPQLIAGVLRIDNAPAQFNVELAFGSGGTASALIYRQCVGPQTVLLFVVKNAAKLSDGGDWLWAKSGKFAVPPQ